MSYASVLRTTSTFILALTVAIGFSTGALAAGTASKEVVKFTLAPGESSKPIQPAADVPVLVMGVQTTVGTRGVGQITLLRVPNNFLEWEGYDIATGVVAGGNSTLTGGYSASAGTHMVWLDYVGQVDLQVANANQFVVHNAGSGTATVEVTLIW
jgi:hypothetical protein